MENNLRTLGPSEAKVVLSLSEKSQSVVQVADVRKILGSENATRKVIQSLTRKGWLSRILGGKYMLLPADRGPENYGENNSLAMAAAAADPSYIGWWSAAAWHGFTTQKPMTVHVAVTKQKPEKIIEGNRVRFIKIHERKFFGYSIYNVYGRSVNISTPEKSLVDCLDRPDLCGGPTELVRITYAALGAVDQSKMIDAAISIKSIATLQRLGFISDFVGRALPDELRMKILSLIPTMQRTYFGRIDRREGDVGYVARWKLYVNARMRDLSSELPASAAIMMLNADS